MDFLSLLAIVLLVALVALFVRTHQVEKMPEQVEFLKGTVPHPLPVGPMRGTVVGLKNLPLDWSGKVFDAGGTGRNRFTVHGMDMEKYAFRIVPARGIRDARDVICIDYDIPSNSSWLRRVLDEMVQIGPNAYLGKAHVRILPGIPFTLGFFRLHP